MLLGKIRGLLYIRTGGRLQDGREGRPATGSDRLVGVNSLVGTHFPTSPPHYSLQTSTSPMTTRELENVIISEMPTAKTAA